MSALRAVAWGWVECGPPPLVPFDIKEAVTEELKPANLRIRFIPAGGPPLFTASKFILQRRNLGTRTKILIQGTFRECCIKAVEILDGPNPYTEKQ